MPESIPDVAMAVLGSVAGSLVRRLTVPADPPRPTTVTMDLPVAVPGLVPVSLAVRVSL